MKSIVQLKRMVGSVLEPVSKIIFEKLKKKKLLQINIFLMFFKLF